MSKRHRPLTPALVLAFVAPAAAQGPAAADAADSSAPPLAAANVVEVTAEDYAFDAPDTIPAGWTTFRLENVGEETHFMILQRLPEGKTFEDYGAEVGAAFGETWPPYARGEIDKATFAEKLGEAIPGWFWEVEQLGGPGLTAPDGKSQMTVHLPPGTYVVECFMRTAEGVFHGEEGMVRPLVVVPSRTAGSEPSADVRLTLTTDAIAGAATLEPGTHRVAVRFAEQPEEGFGNDVHVVRLGPGVTVPQLVKWMDWMNRDGLQNPAPATFLGGTHELAEGSTGYFTVELEPGRYAWISESPDTRALVREFRVER